VVEWVRNIACKGGEMSILAIVGIILAVVNPVIGGVLVGYLVWLDEPDIGFQIILLALTVFSLLVIGFIVWTSRKIRKLEKELKSIQEKIK
jgi:MFS family permease